MHQFSSVQSLSPVRLFAAPWIAAHQASLSITISQSSLKLTSIKLVMPSSHLILCHPLFLLPAIPPSIRVFSSESTLHMRWPKYWSFSFSIITSKEIPELISFRKDWLALLAVQGTLKSLLQHTQFKSINSSVLSFLHSLPQSSSAAFVGSENLRDAGLMVELEAVGMSLSITWRHKGSWLLWPHMGNFSGREVSPVGFFSCVSCLGPPPSMC